jgi:hypothetical protein
MHPALKRLAAETSEAARLACGRAEVLFGRAERAADKELPKNDDDGQRDRGRNLVRRPKIRSGSETADDPEEQESKGEPNQDAD